MAEMFEEPRCATCPIRRKAEEKPNSLLARFWRWHTTWCPGWKAYQDCTISDGFPGKRAISPPGLIHILS